MKLPHSDLVVDDFFRTDFEIYDNEALAIATSRVDDVNFLDQCLLVDQSSTEVAGANVLAHHDTCPSIAVLDRTADVAGAAQAIIRSKFYFQGTSPNAVDTVLVNEWVKDEFIASCREAVTWKSDFVDRMKQSRSQHTIGNKKETDMLLDIDGFTISEVHAG